MTPLRANTMNKRTYATAAPARPRSLVWRVARPLILAGATFYAASVPLALFSLRYRDFVVESLPLGAQLGELLDDYDLRRLRASAEPGAPVAGKAAPHETELTRYAESKARSEGWAVAGNAGTPLEEIKKKLRREEAIELAKKAVAGKTESPAEKASPAAQAALETPPAVAPAKAVAPAPSPAKSAPIDLNRHITADPVPPKTPDPLAVYPEPLPVGFEPPPGYTRPKPAKKAEGIKEAPALPPLPRIADAADVEKCGAPVLAELAGTIDRLSTFVAAQDVAANAGAISVLKEARKDVSALASQIEEIKSGAAAAADAKLKEQAAAFAAELAAADAKLVASLDRQESGWKEAFDAERAKLTEQYSAKLRAELEAQQTLINARLQEQIVAQGIEMQRRWVSQVKSAVESERAGRLARLGELQQGLQKLEAVTAENESALAAAQRQRKLTAAVKALSHRVTSGEPFESELAAVRRISGEDPLVNGVLDSIASSASTGVASFSQLSSHLQGSLAPKLKRVALFPENGGVLAYLGSHVGSLFLLNQDGFSDGDDVPSTLARARFFLSQKDLDAATRQINSLQGWPKKLSKDWLEAARAHLHVQQALDVLDTEVTLNNLASA